MSGRSTTRSNSGSEPLPRWLLGLLALVFAAPAYSQSLGEIARQERERKMNQPHTATHVYTNEDLDRSQILAPEDRERTQARKQASPPPAEPAPETAADEPKLRAMPLGDVARYYRALKSARQKNEPQELPAGVPEFMPSMPGLADLGFPASDVHIPPPAEPTDNARGNADFAGAAAEPAAETAVDERKLRAMPLGDVARYYRALKAARQKNEPQELPAGAPQFMPSMPTLAYPGFPASNGYVAPPAPPDKARSNADIVRALRSSEIPDHVHVRVLRGDTLWSLARRYLGRGRDWILVAAINPNATDPAHLRIGTLLLLPDRTQLAAARVRRSLAPGSRPVSAVADDPCSAEGIPQDAALASAQPNRNGDLQVAPQRPFNVDSGCPTASGHARL